MTSTVTLKGTIVTLVGHQPLIGETAPVFELVGSDLSPVKSADYVGKRVVLNIFPSLDTAVCAMSVRRFNKEASSIKNSVVLAVSKDLPFAFSRFCSVEGIDQVKGGSAFRDESFGKNYGVLIADGPLKGLFARAIVIINEVGKVIYTELVDEITQEPNYDLALEFLKGDYTPDKGFAF